MTSEDLQLLKTFSNWLEQFVDDITRIALAEQNVLDTMPVAELKLARRLHHLNEAISLLDEAQGHVQKVAFDDSQQTNGPRP